MDNPQNQNWFSKRFDQVTGKTELREEIDKLSRAVNYLTGTAYVDGPYELPPDELVRQLGEYDSQIIDELIDQRLFDVLGGVGAMRGDYDSARARSIEDSRRLWIYSPLVSWQISTWTNYGLGDSVSISTRNEKEENCLYFENLKDIKTGERLSASHRSTPIEKIILIKSQQKP